MGQREKEVKAGVRLAFGVILSGTGMYAATQLGVLRALEESGLAPSVLVGVGTGAWIAGLYAHRGDAGEVYGAACEACSQGKRLLDTDRRCASRLVAGGFQGMIRGDRLTALLDEQTKRCTLAELEGSLAIPTLALPTRKTLVFANRCPPDEGDAVWTQQAPLTLAIRAAMAVPALVQPALWMGVPLVGTAGMDLAIATLRQMQVKYALCVDAGSQRPKGKLDVLEIVALSASAQVDATDYPPTWHMLRPRVPEAVRATTLEALDQCLEAGYTATQEVLPRIRAQIGAQAGRVLCFPRRKMPPFVERN